MFEHPLVKLWVGVGGCPAIVAAVGVGGKSYASAGLLERVDTPCEIGIRVGGRNAGDYVVRIDSGGLTYEPGDVEALSTYVEFDAGSFVLTAFGRINGGTVRGDLPTAERFLSSFFRI